MNPQTVKSSVLPIILLISAQFISACSGSNDAESVKTVSVTNTNTGGNAEAGASSTDAATSSGISESVQQSRIPQANLEVVADRTFRISWQTTTGTDFYRVLENPDGSSGYTQIGADIDSETQVYDHQVALYKRVNARYIVQSCNDEGCVDSNELIVSGSLENAIVYIKASNTDGATGQVGSGSGDSFGSTLALSADGNTLAVGARGEDSLATGVNGDQSDNSAIVANRDTGAGAVYVFTRSNEGWQQQAYLKASNTQANNDSNAGSVVPEDEFGSAISISANGNTLAVGAPHEASAATGINGDETDNSARNAGAVYVFERVDQNWQQQAYVKASNAQFDDFFGSTVSVSADGNSLAVGAPYEDSAASGINNNQNDETASTSGAVYVFSRTDGQWQQHSYLKASNAAAEDTFGWTVSFRADGKALAVGAIGEASAATGINGNQSDNSFPRSGAVYVFEQLNDNWQQQAYIKASNTDQIDQFGSALNFSGDGSTLAVGAFAEASGVTGINNDIQRDLSADFAGAAYVFFQDDGSWQQQAYIKASNTDAGDQFGSSVSLSANGSTLAIGAAAEDSIAVGINGDETDNSSIQSGAAYVFTRSNSTWQQQAYLKASNNKQSDELLFFGASVSLSADGDNLAIGAQAEGSAATGVNGDQDDTSAPRSGAVYLY